MRRSTVSKDLLTTCQLSGVLEIGLVEVRVGDSIGGSGDEEIIEDCKPDHLDIPLQPAEIAVRLLHFLLVDQEKT